MVEQCAPSACRICGRPSLGAGCRARHPYRPYLGAQPRDEVRPWYGVPSRSGAAGGKRGPAGMSLLGQGPDFRDGCEGFAVTPPNSKPACSSRSRYSAWVRSLPLSMPSMVRSIILAICGSAPSGTTSSKAMSRAPAGAAALMLASRRNASASDQSRKTMDNRYVSAPSGTAAKKSPAASLRRPPSP
jgi:hypothetical protein